MKKLVKGLTLSLFCLLAGWTAYIANNGNGVNQDVELSDVEALAGDDGEVFVWISMYGSGYTPIEEAQRLLQRTKNMSIEQYCPYARTDKECQIDLLFTSGGQPRGGFVVKGRSKHNY